MKNKKKQDRRPHVRLFTAAAALTATLPAVADINVPGYLLNSPSPIGVLEFLDTNTNTITDTKVFSSAFPSGVAMTPDGRYVYTSDTLLGTLTAFDASTHAIVGTVNGFATPTGMVASPDGKLVYVADPTSNLVSAVDVATRQIVGPSVPLAGSPTGLTISPDGRTLYVSNQDSDTVSVINAASMRVSATIGVGNGPANLAVTPDGGFVYVANSGNDVVSVIDVHAGAVVATIPVGIGPLGIAIAPDGRTAYVANLGDSSVSVIDTATRTVIRTITSCGCGALNVSITPDGRYAYVSAIGGVDVVDTATGNVVQSIFTGGANNPFGAFLGPNVIVAHGGAVPIANDAALGTLGFGNFVNFDGGTLLSTGNLVTGRTVSLLSRGGTFDSNGFSVTLLGTVTGTGSLTKTGAGTLTLANVNSYNGGTFLNGGTIAVSADTNLGDASGGLAFDGGTLQNTAAFTTSRTISLGPGGGTFQTDAGLVSGSVITGLGGLAKTGPASLTLNGANTYTGATTVNAGQLVVGDDAHPAASLASTVILNNGGVLGGIGAVGGITANAGGTVAPGNSIGTLNVAGNVSFAAGSTYVAEIDPSGASDRIAAGGTAVLAGTLNVRKAPGNYLPGTRYTLLTAGGGVSGTFDTLAQDMPFINLGLDYSANDVYLDVSRNQTPFPAVGRTHNQVAAAGAIESLGQGNALYDAVVAQPTGADARAAFDAASGEIHASVKSALIDDSHFLRDAALDRLRGAFSPDGGAPVIAYASNGQTPWASANTADKAFWTQAFGAWAHTNGDGNAGKLGHDTSGAFFGTDARVAQHWRVGALAGYSYTSFDADSRSSSGHSDNIHLGLYGGAQWGAVGLRSGLGYTWHDINVRRSTVFTGYDDNLKTDYNGGTAQIFAELGYRIQAGRLTLEPYANVAYVNLHTDRYFESGGPSALHGAGDDTDTPFTTLGLHASSAFTLGGVQATARGTVGWRHAYGTVTPTANVAFDAGNGFNVAGVPISQNAAVIEAGLDFAIKENLTVGLAYAGQYGSGTRMNSAQANLTWKF